MGESEKSTYPLVEERWCDDESMQFHIAETFENSKNFLEILVILIRLHQVQFFVILTTPYISGTTGIRTRILKVFKIFRMVKFKLKFLTKEASNPKFYLHKKRNERLPQIGSL